MTPASGFELRPRGIGELLDLAFLVYRERFPVFAVLGVALGTAQWGSQLAQQLALGQVGNADANPGTFLLLLYGGFFGSSLLLAVLYAVFSMPILATLDELLKGRNISTGEALRKSLPRIGPVIATALLQLLVTLPFCMCFFVGAFVPMVVLILAVPAVYFEGRGPIGALQRSYQMQIERGGRQGAGDRNWLRAIALMFGTGIVVYALYMFASLPLAIVQMIWLRDGGELLNTAFGPQFMPLYIVLPLQLLGQMLTGVFMPVGILVWGLFYYDIRVRHEALDLELGARELAQETP
ncbi:hypothetical protein ABI59_20720 [Acidobacteria bacterium Mor1]|nr:hypothetical protein ABI59_20720 [Acidobacteria bacterium Mor1]